MKQNYWNLLLVLPLIFLTALACSDAAKSNETVSKPADANKPAKLDNYTIKGIKFAWYKVPAGLKGDELVSTAQKIHEQEPDTQLILIDDDSQMADYIAYAKAISGQGEIDKPMPAE